MIEYVAFRSAAVAFCRFIREVDQEVDFGHISAERPLCAAGQYLQ